MVAKFFGTNGIRGVFPGGLSLRFIHDMSLAIGTHLGGPVLVGYDGRHSSPAICRAACSALNSAGIDCGIAGLVPTPCLEYAVKSLGYSGGLMITASHNPPEYNGIKPVAADGVEISRDVELVVEAIYEKRGWKVSPGAWGRPHDEGRAVRTYLDGVASAVDRGRIGSRGFKVVLDLGNGAQAVTAPRLAGMLGCKASAVNGEIDGAFPGRGSEPTPQNLGELSRAVVEQGADLGVAFDGDGDRSMFCDERGEVLTGDQSALVLVRHLLGDNPGSTVVTCLNSSSAIEALACKSGSEVIRTRVGSVEVSRAMTSSGALAGFEENGGFMYGRHNQVRDGCMTLALMLDLLASSGRTLSAEAADVPESFTAKDKVRCPEGSVPGILEALRAEFPGADTTDGIRIATGPRDWVMIRPSGTEPVVRIYAEASERDMLGGVMSEYVDKVRSLIP